MAFWRDVVAVGSQSGEAHRGVTSLGGPLDRYTEITWQLDEVDEVVEIRVPANPFFEFEPVEPQRLEHGTNIVLLGRRKDG